MCIRDRCETVLAKEEVENGECWRCGSTAIRKDMEQWFFRITDYADRLLEDIDLLEYWPERVRSMQRNWIGKSIGVIINFKVHETGAVSYTHLDVYKRQAIR